MKHYNSCYRRMCCLFMLHFLMHVVGHSQVFNFQTWNSSNQSTLTVTAFRSVTIDKRGIVWVGSDLGGLYNYKDTTWKKIGTYPDITFRHMVPSNISGDSNVWAASIGKTAVQAITGGAYYINTGTETVTQYGSGLFGGLGSRYANSLALSNQGKVYVALAVSTTGSTTNQGGVYVSSTLNPPAPSATSFTKAIPDVAGAGDIIYHSAGNRGDELWFGRGSNCSGTCQAPYIARLTGSGAILSSITASNSPLPFTATSASSFARAIFTDTITGNTFVGLSSGGVGVYRPNGTWKMLTSANSPFPPSAAVNFNAIAEVYGEIWIGTTAGVFVYDGTSSLDSATSYKLLTTANGLPSNSVTDIAVDTVRSQIWITSSAGVSRCNYVPPFIKGIVYNVYCNRPESRPDSLKLFETLQKAPATTGVTIRLLENGTVEKESVTVNANGVFNLVQAEDGKSYTIEIKYENNGKKITYLYSAVKNHSNLGAILIPDGLIDEVKAFKVKLEKRCFKFGLPYFTEVCREGFNTTEYNKSYQAFFETNGVQSDHKKKVENLADFYSSLGTVYSLGGTSTELINKSIVNAFDAIEAMFSLVKFNTVVQSKTKAFREAHKKLLLTSLKIFKDDVLDNLKKSTSNLSASPEVKSLLGDLVTMVEDAATFGINALDDGGDKAATSFYLDIIKKELARQLAASYYKNYCLIRHKNFMTNAANSSNTAFSSLTYDQVFNNHQALQTSAADQFTLSDGKIDTYTSVAKYADYAAEIGDAASVLALLPGGQVAGGIAKAVAVVAKIVKTTALTGAMLEGADGCVKVANFSSQVLPSAGFTTARLNAANRIFYTNSQQSPDSLRARKNSYNQKLQELKVIYNTPAYDSATYFNKYQEFAVEDSLYTDEMAKTLNALWASADSASLLIPGFTGKLNKVIDSFVSKQYVIRNAFLYQNLGYIYDTDKSVDTAELNSMANQIMILNDSAVNGITYLTGDINTNGVGAPAYLVQETYLLNHSHLPGSSGSFIYTFKNYGTQPQDNVSFKLVSEKTGGYIFSGPDSVNVGTIGAGQSKQVTFNFTSPLNDSICRYVVQVHANNGSFQSVSGSLYVKDPLNYYTVKDGNWSDITTWNGNAIPPTTVNVVVSHAVTVDMDVNCKSIKTQYPGNITVKTGRLLKVQQ